MVEKGHTIVFSDKGCDIYDADDFQVSETIVVNVNFERQFVSVTYQSSQSRFL